MVFDLPEAWIAPVFLPAGVLTALWMVLAYRSERRYLKNALRATGVIDSVFAEPGSLGKAKVTFYYPVVRFTTAAGVAVTARSKSGRNGGFRVGDRINILYDEEDPSNVQIDAFWSRWLIVIGAAFFTVFFLGIGISKVLPR